VLTFTIFSSIYVWWETEHRRSASAAFLPLLSALTSTSTSATAPVGGAGAVALPAASPPGARAASPDDDNREAMSVVPAVVGLVGEAVAVVSRLLPFFCLLPSRLSPRVTTLFGQGDKLPRLRSEVFLCSLLPRLLTEANFLSWSGCCFVGL